ncbi:MAG: Ig-like domain-containing protein [Lachnospiraceae bacterium]
MTWKSSNSSIASVSKTGIVTGLSMLMTDVCHR